MNQAEKRAQSYYQAAMKIVAQLPSADLHPINNRLADLYDTKERIGKGVYAIYEKGKLMYIGRTSKAKEGIRQRITYHLSRSVKAGGATLTRKLTPIKKPKDLKDRKSNEAFEEAFKKTADRVRKMDIRFVECSDINTQAIAEVLAIAIFEPPYSNNQTS